MKGSTIVLNTLADNETSLLYFAVKCSPLLTSTPTHSLKSGDGKYFSIAIISALNPCASTPEPIITGTISPLQIFSLSAVEISSSLNSSPERYLSMYSSLVSATASIKASLAIFRLAST